MTAILGLSLVYAPVYGSTQREAGNKSAENENLILYLGNIQVHGQKNIVKTLQAIKVALQRPYSSDPKFANVMVCRFQDEAGSHLQQWLICGTNRTLAANRDALQTQMTATAHDSDQPTDPGAPGSASCTSRTCYEEASSVLDDELSNQPGHYLHIQVNGPGLRALLNKIPNPAAQPPKTKAPAASTRQP